MFQFKQRSVFVTGMSLLMTMTLGCKGAGSNSGSSLDFASNGLFQFQGDSQSELVLHSAPMTSLGLATGRSSLSSVTDYFFRLKFYQVTYATLQTPVNGSYEGDVNAIVDTGREMNISRDNLLGGSITITPVFDNGQFLVDGYYVIVMCQNRTVCAPPAAATLSAYKDAFLAGKCGSATEGISTQCYNTLFQDQNSSYMGIVYPLTVQNKKFTQGDYDLAYNAGSTASLALAGGNIESQYIFESAGGGYEPVLQTNGSGQNIYDTLSASSTPSVNANTASSSPSGSNTSQNFWNGIGKALVWLGNNTSSTPDNTAANNAASAQKTAAANAASAAANAASATAAGARSHDCFLAGSRIAVVVLAADGSVAQIGEKAIENLAVGDYVYNPLLRTAARVKAVFKQGNTDAIYTLTINSTTPQVNKELTVTAAHPVITKSGLKPVALLTADDKVMMVNKIPVTSQLDYSWFSVEKLLRTSTPNAVQVYNLQIDDTVQPIKVGADASGAWWYYALSTDTSTCPNDGEGCSKYFVSSNQLVTGDLTRQQETEKLLQQAFVQLNKQN